MDLDTVRGRVDLGRAKVWRCIANFPRPPPGAAEPHVIDIGVLRKLAAAGATVEMILSAIETDQSAEQAKLYERRVKDAERQRRKRANNGHAESHGVTRSHADVPLPPIKPPTPQTSESKKIPRSTPGKPMPDNWLPDERCSLYAKSKGWDLARIRSEGERFRNHSLSTGRIHKNVFAAWCNWVTSPYQTNGGKPKPDREAEFWDPHAGIL